MSVRSAERKNPAGRTSVIGGDPFTAPAARPGAATHAGIVEGSRGINRRR